MAAVFFSVVITIAVLFQIALALGAPWGKAAMGGRFPGRFPPAMRLAAAVQSIVLALTAAVVLTRSGLIFPQWSENVSALVWGVTALFALGFAMNLITPSRIERLLWAPLTAVLFGSSLCVAIGC